MVSVGWYLGLMAVWSPLDVIWGLLKWPHGLYQTSQCTLINDLMVSIRWYLGSLKLMASWSLLDLPMYFDSGPYGLCWVVFGVDGRMVSTRCYLGSLKVASWSLSDLPMYFD